MCVCVSVYVWHVCKDVKLPCSFVCRGPEGVAGVSGQRRRPPHPVKTYLLLVFLFQAVARNMLLHCDTKCVLSY